MANSKPQKKQASTSDAAIAQTKAAFCGTLLGREALIRFPQSTVQVTYSVRGEMKWCVTDKDGNESHGVQQQFGYLQLTESLHFLNWIEKTGFTVSQLIDTENGTVKGFWSYADGPAQGARASMFVNGTFAFTK